MPLKIMTDKHLTDTTFSDLGLAEPLLKALHEKGYTHCTPIQEKALPVLLNGRDVAGQAQTGTGKTATFLLATFNDLLNLKEVEGRKPYEPRALILAPTRELAVQIYDDAIELAKYTDFKIGLVYGGANYRQQKDQFDQGVDILIGTTGRTIDYFKQGEFNLGALDVMVLDEADRMFDLGFIADIRYLFRRMPPATDRLNMLFSATLSHRVQELAYEHMNQPEHVQVQPKQVTAKAINQHLYYPANEEKIPLLLALFKQHEPEKSIIFVNTKREAETVSAYLESNGYDAGLLTGDVPQKKRMALLDKLKNSELQTLIATDVAARGLHIPDVSYVFNYDLPEDPEDYVHRIGRTARAGAKGDAISFACEGGAANLPDIEELIGFSLEKTEFDREILEEPIRPKRIHRHHSGQAKSGRPRRKGPRRK